MKLSIITINYNNIEGLKKTVDSVNKQVVRNDFEYIVVDGNSSDGAKEYLSTSSPLFDKWVSEPDKGIYNAMNKGVSMASGEYILFINSGDCLHDSTVINQVLGQLTGEDLIIGKILFLNSGEMSKVEEPITLKRFYRGSIPHPATFTKKDLLVKNPFDESLRIVSDWKFFITVLVLNKCSYRLIDTLITDFDTDGISATNIALTNREREIVLKELIPEAILLDYVHFEEGSGYSNTPYDNFFITLRKYQYGRMLYSIDVFIMKIIAIFRKGAKFANNFPTKL